MADSGREGRRGDATMGREGGEFEASTVHTALDVSERAAEMERLLHERDEVLKKVRAQLANSEQSNALLTAELNSERNKSSAFAERTRVEQRRLRAALEGKRAELQVAHRAFKDAQDRGLEWRRSRRADCQVGAQVVARRASGASRDRHHSRWS